MRRQIGRDTLVISDQTILASFFNQDTIIDDNVVIMIVRLVDIASWEMDSYAHYSGDCSGALCFGWMRIVGDVDVADQRVAYAGAV